MGKGAGKVRDLPWDRFVRVVSKRRRKKTPGFRQPLPEEWGHSGME
jgi:hypothetical protein